MYMRLFEVQYLEFILRILLAGFCGICIGFERKRRSKGAGVRTHCVVACAAALMMIVSKYGFFDVIGEGMYNGVEVRLDPSRIASTIASGIGFLGAGTIFVHKNNVTGLTTAAGIWATSGVGMAIGSGLYLIGFAATLILVLSHVFLHMKFKWIQGYKTKKLTINKVDDEDYQTFLRDKFRSMNIRIQESSARKGADGKTDYTYLLEMPETLSGDEVLAFIKYECELSFHA